MKVSLLTGGQEIYYSLGLLSGLISNGVNVDFIGNDAMQRSDIIKDSNVNYYNLRGDQSPDAGIRDKGFRVLKYYSKLIRYAYKTDSNVFHIQWLNKFTFFDRTVLNIYYKLLGKKIVFTAHDINFKELVGKDNFINRISLKILYRLVDRIIVHTKDMKIKLLKDFDVRCEKVCVIPHGINIIIPKNNVSREESREILNIHPEEKILLFFGNMAPYKGLEYLILALSELRKNIKNLKLIVAGRVKKNCEAYWKTIEKMIEEYGLKENIILRAEFIPDTEVEYYFKAADVLVLPYKHIFQSGVIFTSYVYGLPVIATDVGALSKLIEENKTGFICSKADSNDIANTIQKYYSSELFKNLEDNREKIVNYALKEYSWEKSGEMTYKVYRSLK